jgi:divalent metal cation (Fe/Co/Zn/Cd) transporter
MATFSRKLLLALAEIGFIVFLFYTNLLMGQFTRTRSAAHAASIMAALYDVFTPANALIGLTGAIIGYFCIEGIRKRLL